MTELKPSVILKTLLFTDDLLKLFWMPCSSILTELKPSVILKTLLFNYDWTVAFSYSGYPALQLWLNWSLLFNYDWTEAFSYSGYPALNLWWNWSLQLFWIPCSSIMMELKPSVILDTLLFTYDWTEAFSHSGYPALNLWLNWSLRKAGSCDVFIGQLLIWFVTWSNYQEQRNPH